MAQQDAQRLDPSTDSADADTLTGQPGEAGMGARSEEFTREISQLKLSGSSAETESRVMKLGIAGLVIPIVMAIVGILLVMSTSDAADQRAYASQTFWLGNIIAIVGAALFIRYSLGRYLRFWMIRLIHEQRAQTDRLVDALERTSARRD